MSKTRRGSVTNHLARVDEDRRHPVTDDDIRSLIEAYGSSDPEIRVRALKASCPCHIPWDVYERLRKPALRLRRDPDPHVRALALHLEEDGRSLERMEADMRRWADDDERAADLRRERTRNQRR